jgi:hypothetical protein
MGGKRPYLLEGERSFLLGRLAEKPDLTLHALLSELRERGVAVSCDTLWRFLRRAGAGFKKTLFASEQDRPDVARRRTLGKKIPLRLDPRRLVFIDGQSMKHGRSFDRLKTNMTDMAGTDAARRSSPRHRRVIQKR